MGKQINFLMDSETEEKFIEYILSDGILLFEGNNMRPVKMKSFPEPFSSKAWFKLYLYKDEFGDLKLKKLDEERKYIDVIVSPVIEFSRTIIRDSAKEISRGRLWVEMNFYNDKNELVSKKNDLEEWFKNLSKWIKKHLPKTEIIGKNKVYSEYSCMSINNKIENGYKIM